ALRDDVRTAAFALDAFGLLGEEAIAVAPRRPRDPPDLRTRHAIEQDVARRRRRSLRAFRTQDQHAPEAELRRRQRGRARVVALLAAARDHVGRLLLQRLGHQVLVLADLVPGQLAAGVVIALHPEPDAELLAVAQPVSPGRGIREPHARRFLVGEAFEHGASLPRRSDEAGYSPAALA